MSTTLEKYCEVRWGWHRSRAYQLIAYVDLPENVDYSRHSEFDVRPLTKLKDPAQQREAFEAGA